MLTCCFFFFFYQGSLGILEEARLVDLSGSPQFLQAPLRLGV